MLELGYESPSHKGQYCEQSIPVNLALTRLALSLNF